MRKASSENKKKKSYKSRLSHKGESLLTPISFGRKCWGKKILELENTGGVVGGEWVTEKQTWKSEKPV